MMWTAVAGRWRQWSVAVALTAGVPGADAQPAICNPFCVTAPTPVSSVPTAQAKNGDTHITGQGIVQTIDCNESTLLVIGTGNQINALGICWAVTVQGSSNIVVADNVVNDITVYG